MMFLRRRTGRGQTSPRLEVEGYTGELVKLRGERAKRPKLVWRSVLPERKYVPGFPRAAAAVWLRAVGAELKRIADSATTAIEGSQGTNDDMEGGDWTRDDGVGAPHDPEGGGDDDMIEDDANEEDGSGGDEAQGTARGRPPADSWGQSCRALQDIIGSIYDDFPSGEPDDASRETRDALLDLARDMFDAAMPDRPDYTRDEEGRWTPQEDIWWDRRAATALAALAPRADALRIDLEAMTKAALATRQADDSRKWKEWLSHDFAAGASRAHAYSRLPQEVIPEAVEDARGTMTGTPEELLTAQRNKYRELWKPAQGPFHYKWRNKDELPQLTPEQLRTASSSFRARTAQTYDGFHPRQLACLSDSALQILSTILQAVEVSGRWPRQLDCVVTALLPKPRGGYRPIGLLPAAYRVWAKARRVHADRWEAQHARQYLSSAKGNGPQDTMWRMAARHEAGTAEGEQAGIVADDLAAFFETIDRQVLMREAAALGYPAPLLRAALAAYSSARMVTLHGRVAREVYPTVGVIAGCSLAMSLVKLFYLRAMDSLVVRLPSSVVLDVHVDDLTLSAIGRPGCVAADLTAAREDLVSTLSALGCAIAPDKTAVTATTRRLANDIARRAGITKGATMAPCLLGVDSTAGGKRARLKAGSKKAGRLRAALARRARLSTIRKAVGRRANKIFRTGLLPAATYGAAVWGVADAEVAKLRRLAATTMSPRAPGRSLAMVTLWHGVPTADAEHAPVLAYANMVWRAMTRRDEAAMRQSSLADLRRTWEAAQAHFEPLVKAMQEERQDDGSVPPATARRVWAQVNGPLAAAAVTLARLRWTFPSPFVLRDAEGEDHVLTATSPALIRDHLRNALRDSLELKIGYKCAAADEGFEGRRACLDLAIAASRPSRKVTSQQSAAFRAVACGAVWTASRAQELGYVTDGLCALCRKARDTIHHRVYECEETRQTVRGAVPGWFWSEAMRTGAHGPFWTAGLFPHPADIAPRPRSDLYCEVERHRENGEQGAEGEGCADLEGRVYVDGTCKPSAIRGLARAAVSLIKATKEGAPIKTLQLPVPRGLPQTSQAAEFLAMSVGFTCAVGPTELIGDCLGVVNKFTAAVAKALSPACKYAGLVLAAYRRPEIRRTALVRWTKAHRSLKGDEPEEEVADVRGNSAADAAAKDANSLHPPHGTDVDAEVAYRERRIPHVVAAVAAAMSLFPPAPRRMERQPKPRTADEARETKRHLWRFSAGAWRCAECDDFITSRCVPRYRQYQTCSGRGFADAAPSFAGNGHALVKVDSDLPIVLCTKCGAWGNRRTRKLGRPCGPPTAAGVQAVARVRGGHHPLLQHDRGGNVLPRAHARIVAAYDCSRGCWVGCDPPPCGGSHHDGAQDQGHAAAEAAAAAAADDTMGDVAIESGYASEEDVFGHGGGLDNLDVRGNSATQPLPAAAPTAGGPVTRASRRRTADHSATRDFTAEAVQRLGSSLARRDTDATGRMQQLRRRVAARAAADRDGPGCGAAADSATTAHGGDDAARQDLALSGNDRHGLRQEDRRRAPALMGIEADDRAKRQRAADAASDEVDDPHATAHGEGTSSTGQRDTHGHASRRAHREGSPGHDRSQGPDELDLPREVGGRDPHRLHKRHRADPRGDGEFLPGRARRRRGGTDLGAATALVLLPPSSSRTGNAPPSNGSLGASNEDNEDKANSTSGIHGPSGIGGTSVPVAAADASGDCSGAANALEPQLGRGGADRSARGSGSHAARQVTAPLTRAALVAHLRELSSRPRLASVSPGHATRQRRLAAPPITAAGDGSRDVVSDAEHTSVATAWAAADAGGMCSASGRDGPKATDSAPRSRAALGTARDATRSSVYSAPAAFVDSDRGWGALCSAAATATVAARDIGSAATAGDGDRQGTEYSAAAAEMVAVREQPAEPSSSAASCGPHPVLHQPPAGAGVTRRHPGIDALGGSSVKRRRLHGKQRPSSPVRAADSRAVHGSQANSPPAGVAQPLHQPRRDEGGPT